jgi:hypothetical protein
MKIPKHARNIYKIKVHSKNHLAIVAYYINILQPVYLFEAMFL